jgi:predicted glycoside hydrolase/deacetylase ChbG (UPF0249 family)
MLPRLLDVLIKLAKEYDIPAIRFPHSDRLSGNLNARVAIKALMLRAFENKIETQLRMSHIISPQHFRGFFDSGNITEEVLLDIISNLENGDTELVCHPGYLGKEVIDHYTFHKNCEAELFALTSPRVKRLLEEKQVTLTSYSDFLSSNHIAVLPYMVRSTK